MKKKIGGARPGAGRKKGSGPFGEPTKVVRIPESKVPVVKAWLKSLNQVPECLTASSVQVLKPASQTEIHLPLYGHKVVAGFPSPAEDYIEAQLDLNDYLIQNKEATFILKVQGDSMKNAGIMDGDLLIVDKSMEPTDGKIVIAALNGELTVKRLSIKSTGAWLVPENDDYPPIPIKEESDVMIWGVVTATISQF
ncbi:LexA family protein [Galenea microaerophila]